MPLKVPLAHPEPDAKRFIRILSGSESGGRVPLVEYLVDDAIMKPVVTEILGRPWAEYGASRQTQKAHLDNFIAFWLRMGYDTVRFEQGLPFTERRIFASDPTSAAEGKRAWADPVILMSVLKERTEGTFSSRSDRRHIRFRTSPASPVPRSWRSDKPKRGRRRRGPTSGP